MDVAHQKLSKRETEIAEELIRGKINSEVAAQLNISENTVKTHIKHIFKKLNVNNRTELSYLLMKKNN